MNKVLRGLARAVSLLAAVAVAAVIILYPRLVAEDSASVPHGFLVVLLMGMSAAWVHGFGFVPENRILRVSFFSRRGLARDAHRHLGRVSALRQLLPNALSTQFFLDFMSQTTLYERLGGEAGLTALVDKYLEILRSNPAYAALSSRYVNGMAHYRARMLEYLTGWFGGPVLYAQKHGLPCLRENHQRIQITAELRDLWFGCMQQALAESVSDETLRSELEAVFWQMADSLRNA